MTTSAGLTQAELDAIKEFDPESAARLQRGRKAALDNELPEPTEDDINRLRIRLDSFFHDWIHGDGGQNSATEDADGATDPAPIGVPGLMRIRAMRYHKDQMPQKYRELLAAPYRFRSNLTANEIDRTVALATRNMPKIGIAAAGREPEDRRKSQSETRWANMLLPSLERAAGEPLLYPFADALFEGGVGYFEVFQTGAYDTLDFDQGAGETDDAYVARTDSALLKAEMPFGVRVPDPLAVRIGLNDYGAQCALVIETKPYRQVFARLEARVSQDQLDALKLPKPGDRGAPVVAGMSSGGWTVGDDGSVECIRYLDPRWYCYMVAGKIVTSEEHGMPGLPIIPSWGSVTSSSNFAQKYQGIVWGTIDQEQAINDLVTTELDIGIQFARPKATIETPVGGRLRGPDGKPQNIDLRGINGVPELMPGQKVVDAFKDFKSHIDPRLLAFIMQLRQNSSLNPVAAGESPGADPSGFAINSLQASTQMRYEVLIDNYGRTVGQLVDFIRKMVKEGPIAEQVNLAIEGDDGVVENLSLGPDDISDVPCVVAVDSMNDVNRLAQRDSLMVGNERGFVPRRIVMELGFGATDARAWDDELFEDEITRAVQGLAVQHSIMLVSPQPQDPMLQPTAPTDAGAADGGGGGGDQGGHNNREQQAGAPSGDNGATPAPTPGSTVGRAGARASQGGSPGSRSAARARGGQQPRNQGVGP